MRETKYAKELASVEDDECRIERILVKDSGRVEIRFSWWPKGKFSTRPLDLPQEHLLRLMEKAIKGGVFDKPFVDGLREMLGSR